MKTTKWDEKNGIRILGTFFMLVSKLGLYYTVPHDPAFGYILFYLEKVNGPLKVL